MVGCGTAGTVYGAKGVHRLAVNRAVRAPSKGLLRLASAFIVLTAFDWFTVSSVPFMRTGSAVIGMLLACTYLIYRLKDFRIYRGPQLLAVVFVLMMVLFAALRLLTGNSAQAPYLMQWVQVQVLFIIFCDLTRHRAAFLYVWMSIVLVVFTMALLSSLGLEGLEQQTSGGRAGLSTMNLNRQAYWYSLGLLTMVWLLLEMWRKSRRDLLLLIGISAFILLYAILRTGSRSALLSVAAAMPVLVFGLARKRNWKAFKLVVPFLVIGFVSSALYFDTALERLSATVHGGEDQSRLVIWEQAVALVKSNPLTGYGPGFIEVLNLGVDESQGINTHNSHLQIATAYGLPALFLWWSLIITVIGRVWRRRHLPSGALFLSVLALSVIYSFTGDLGYNRYFWIMLALAGNVHFMDTLLRQNSRRLLCQLGGEPRTSRAGKDTRMISFNRTIPLKHCTASRERT